MTTAGVITEFSVPTANSGPSGITAGPDGNLWFTEGGYGFWCRTQNRTNHHGRRRHRVLDPHPAQRPCQNHGGPGRQPLVHRSCAGYPVPGRTIGRITTAGVITEFPTPTASSSPRGIAAGPDGNLWFTETTATSNQIGRITTAGVVTEFSIPTAFSYPVGITAGPDGNLWFTEQYANQIGRITTAGVVTEFPIPTAGSYPAGIAAGPDGNLWFTEGVANQIGRIIPRPSYTKAHGD